MERAIQELRDTVIVMAHIEKRQSEILRAHAEELGELLEFRHRTEQNLAEITDKLNGLIGYIDSSRPSQQP